MAGLSAPRPLHLASGSFIASLNSPGELLPSSQFDIPTSVGNFNPVPIGTNGTNCKHGTAVVQPQTPVTAMKHQLAHKSRRHSSISYIHSNSNSSHSLQRESMDGLLRSPLPGPHTVTAFDVRQVAPKSSPSASVKFWVHLEVVLCVALGRMRQIRSEVLCLTDGAPNLTFRIQTRRKA